MPCKKLNSLNQSKGKKLFVEFVRKKYSSLIIKSTPLIVKEMQKKDHILIIFFLLHFLKIPDLFFCLFSKRQRAAGFESTIERLVEGDELGIVFLFLIE